MKPVLDDLGCRCLTSTEAVSVVQNLEAASYEWHYMVLVVQAKNDDDADDDAAIIRVQKPG